MISGMGRAFHHSPTQGELVTLVHFVDWLPARLTG